MGQATKREYIGKDKLVVFDISGFSGSSDVFGVSYMSGTFVLLALWLCVYFLVCWSCLASWLFLAC